MKEEEEEEEEVFLSVHDFNKTACIFDPLSHGARVVEKGDGSKAQGVGSFFRFDGLVWNVDYPQSLVQAGIANTYISFSLSYLDCSFLGNKCRVCQTLLLFFESDNHRRSVP